MSEFWVTDRCECPSDGLDPSDCAQCGEIWWLTESVGAEGAAEKFAHYQMNEGEVGAERYNRGKELRVMDEEGRVFTVGVAVEIHTTIEVSRPTPERGQQ